MKAATPLFEVGLARDAAERAQALRLRYTVFVEELGADGPLVDHHARLEQDAFDTQAQMLVLRDLARTEEDRIVGVYRLLPSAGCKDQPYYSDQEYDLSRLKASGKRLLELGRSCLHPDYRGGAAMYHLWQGLAAYVAQQEINILFGVASFHGTDVAALMPSLSFLHYNHLAPAHLRVTSRVPQPMDLIALADLDRVAAVQNLPALIKAYLRLGGYVGEGAYIDHAFNTTDVCLVMETTRLSDRQRAIYAAPSRTRRDE